MVLVTGLALYFVTGALIGQWRALLLLVVPILFSAALVRGVDVDGVQAWKWLLVDTVTLVGPAMLVGIALGKATHHLQRRRRLHGLPTSPASKA